MLLEDGLDDHMTMLEQVIQSDYTNGDDVHFSPLVEFSPTFHWSPKSGRFSGPFDGTGPRGRAIMRDPGELGEVLNGKAKHFSSNIMMDAGI
jgi:hypothetical protein